MNNCTFVGNIGRDAETRYTQAGKAVTGWSIAVNTGFGDDKKTLWIDCSLWGERGGKLAEYIRKGKQICVAGEIGTREHNGKTYVTLNVREVTLLGNKEGHKEQAKSPAEKAATEQKDGFEDSEIPF